MKRYVVPVIPDEMVFSWESQAAQYERKGEPGFALFIASQRNTDDLKPGEIIHCLLYYDKTGVLRGVLNHYPQDLYPHEVAGNVNMWVDPAQRRKGIGTALLREAMSRWTINLYQQRYSELGIKFINSFTR